MELPDYVNLKAAIQIQEILRRHFPDTQFDEALQEILQVASDDAEEHVMDAYELINEAAVIEKCDYAEYRERLTRESAN